MKFGAVAPKDALGATAVHTIRQGTLVLKKGTLCLLYTSRCV